MMLVENMPVPVAALPVDGFKDHLRLGTGFAGGSVQDPVLESFLRAAIASIEARTSKALISRDFTWSAHEWQRPDNQPLPLAPVSAIQSVTIKDRQGAETVIPAESYWLEADSQTPRIRAVGTCLPTIPSRGSVSVAFTAGFGAAWEDIPPDLGQAVMLLAAHYYEYRDDTSLTTGCMPFGVASLIERYRAMRVLGGSAAR